MSRVATIIGAKGGKWSSISVGPATEQREEYKRGKFAGFDKILYLDSSGGTRRKRGQKKAPAAKAKGKGEKATE